MLDQLSLKQAILRVIDRDRDDFVGFPLELDDLGAFDRDATNRKVGENWADAALTYFALAVVPPPPALQPVVAHAGARTAMAERIAAELRAGQDANEQRGLAALAAGFAAYAGALALASIPLVGLVTPPPASPVFVLAPGSADTAAATMATAVDVWARTGTFLVTGGVVPAPWS